VVDINNTVEQTTCM